VEDTKKTQEKHKKVPSLPTFAVCENCEELKKKRMRKTKKMMTKKKLKNMRRPTKAVKNMERKCFFFFSFTKDFLIKTHEKEGVKGYNTLNFVFSSLICKTLKIAVLLF